MSGVRESAVRALIVALPLAAPGAYAGGAPLSPGQEPAGAHPSRQMADGKQWMVENLSVETGTAHCYGDGNSSCRRYGRLYTWDSAQRACLALGDGWRLPTDDEWRRLASSYGGVSEDAADRGRAAYAALSKGGLSGFDALLGGGRSPRGEYARLEAHGFYWTASATGASTATYYNFGKGGPALHRQREGEKQWAFSVRCIRE